MTLVLIGKKVKAVKEYIKSKCMDLQFVESCNHRINAAEHGCKAVKYHMIATVCIIDPACPVQLWDRFVPQIEATLNTMRTSRIDSSKLAYEALNGQKLTETEHL